LTTPEFSWWFSSAESDAKSTNIVEDMLRNAWSPTGPPLRKLTSARAALDPQHPVLDNAIPDPDLAGISPSAEIQAIDVPWGLRSLRNHGSPLGSPSDLPEVDLVDSRLS
jgi:hypothetical protein